MMLSVFDEIEDIVVMGKKFWFPAFSPFPTMFSKVPCFRDIKSRVLSGKEFYALRQNSTL